MISFAYQAAHLLCQADISSHTQCLVALQGSITRTSYKWVIVVTSVLQLWRAHAADPSSAGAHPFIRDEGTVI